MGRGRAKAKQQKVARDLKYNTTEIDVGKLQAELGRPGARADGPAHRTDDDDDERDDDEPWASNYS